MAEQGYREAALVLLLAAAEAIGRQLASGEQVRVQRWSPVALFRGLVHHGLIDREDAERLVRAYVLRNRIVHGIADRSVKSAELADVLEAVKRLGAEARDADNRVQGIGSAATASCLSGAVVHRAPHPSSHPFTSGIRTSPPPHDAPAASPLEPRMAEPRYRPADLVDLAASLFARAGAPATGARTIAQLLVEADLMGHTTHGLALAGRLPRRAESGRDAARRRAGGGARPRGRLTWDGRRSARRLAHRPARSTWPPTRADGSAPAPSRSAAATTSPASPRSSTRATDRGPDADRRQLRPVDGERRAVRRPPRGVHPRPARGRHPDRRRPDPDRHQRLDHDQRHEQPARRRGPALPGAPGCSTPPAAPPTTRRCFTRTRPARSCRPAGSTTATRATAWR